MLQIGVIGAGIVGLSSAVNIQTAIPKARVTIIADKFGPDTVSHGAGGFFRPDFHSLKGNKEVLRKCVHDSWNFYCNLAMSEKSCETGQSLVAGLLASDEPKDDDYEVLKSLSFGFRRVSNAELERRKIPVKVAYSCTTVVTECPKFLPWLMKTFRRNGGQIQRRTLSNIDELYGEFQLVVNCCGFRAETLVRDKECYPVRGQLVMVKAPWVKSFFFTEDIVVIPHADKVIIGGIKHKGNYDNDVDLDTEETILKRAEAIFPELKGAERLYGWAATRPARTEIRLETEMMNVGQNGKLPVIHNYGHGGHGITLGWGCGRHAAMLAKKALASIPHAPL